MKKNLLLILFLLIGLNTKLFADCCFSASTPTLSASAGVQGVTGVSGSMICSGSSVTLSVASGNLEQNTQWAWYVVGCGDIASGSGTQIVVTPSVTTTYYCRGEGDVSPGSCGQITINNFYQSKAIGTDASRCSPGSLVLSATINAGETVDWYASATGGSVLAGGSGTTSYTTPVISTTTTYYAQARNLTTGCTSFIRTPVYAIVGVFAIASSNSPLCAGNILNLHSSGGGSGYSWTGPNGFTSSLQNPVISNPTSADTGTYTVTVTNACGSTSSSTTVAFLTANISASGSTALCSGNSVLLSANTGSGLSYQWQLNSSNIPGATASTFSTPAAGTYTCIVSGTCGSLTSNTITVTVNPLPTPFINGTLSICSGSSTTLSTNNFSSYLWSTGETTQSINVSTAGTFTVTVTDGNGCTASANTPVSENQTPTINPVGSQTLCNGSATAAINFTGTGSVYNWMNNTPSIGLTASGTGNIASFNATNSGTSPVTATITATPLTVKGFAYITLDGGGVSVIDIVSNNVVATLTGFVNGQQQNGISVSPDGSKAYVGNYCCGSVTVFNTVNNSPIATIAVGSATYGLAVSPDGNKLYVANLNGNVTVVNTATNSVITYIQVGFNPTNLVVSLDGSRVYVGNYGSNTISVINGSTDSVIATFAVPGHPRGLSVTPDGSRLYVNNDVSNNISVINTATDTIITTIAAGNYPIGSSVSPDGSRVYVTNYNSNTVSVINTTTNTITATIAVGNLPRGISVSPDGSKIYVANSGSRSVSVINTFTNTVIDTIAVGISPYAEGNFIIEFNCSGAPTTFNITVNPTSTSSSSAIACNSYVWQGVTYTASTSVTDHFTNAAGCDSAATLNLIITNSCPATLSLKMFIQGYYKGIGSSTPMDNLSRGGCLYASGVSTDPTEVDTITISLMDPNTQSQVGASAKGILHTDGTVWQNGSSGVTFPGSVIGKSYYIKITHRSALETWSANPVSFGLTTSYNFSSGSGQAYGNNMVKVDRIGGQDVFALWNGDVFNTDNGNKYSQDGVIESADYGLVEEDYTSILFGYHATDITGDGVVESLDYSLTEGNYSIVIFKATPW